MKGPRTKIRDSVVKGTLEGRIFFWGTRKERIKQEKDKG